MHNRFHLWYIQESGGGLDYDPGMGKGRSVPNSGGGDFISVHLRVADYLRARPGSQCYDVDIKIVSFRGLIYVLLPFSSFSHCLWNHVWCAGAVPSLKGAANQLNILKEELKLSKVFLASDAAEDGERTCKLGGLPTCVRFAWRVTLNVTWFISTLKIAFGDHASPRRGCLGRLDHECDSLL